MVFNLVLNGEFDEDSLGFFKRYDGPGARWVGIDRGALTVMRHKFPLHAAIGDFDSVTPAQLRAIKAKAVVFIKYPSQKDETDFEAGLNFLLTQKGVSAIRVFGWNGGRLDQLLSNLTVLGQRRYRPLVPLAEFVDLNNWAKVFLPGEWEVANFAGMRYVSFHTLWPTKNLTLRGFKYRLDGYDVKASVTLSSNEFVGRWPGVLSFDRGMVLATQGNDAKKSGRKAGRRR